VFGFTDRFNEFFALFGYLFRRRNLAVLVANETTDLNPDSVPLKTELTRDERDALAKLMVF
jgi:hypothetical protein